MVIPETVTNYGIPEVKGGTQPLTAPEGVGHALLHDMLKLAVDNMNLRVNELITTATEHRNEIYQARLVANVWYIAEPEADGLVTGPVLWNLMGREATFESAKITVEQPPIGGDLEVDLMIGGVEEGLSIAFPQPDSFVAITAAPLTITAGNNTCETVIDFVSTSQPENSFVVPLIRTTGDANDPGYGLSIQLNRSL
jgi:hypothetical protein